MEAGFYLFLQIISVVIRRLRLRHRKIISLPTHRAERSMIELRIRTIAIGVQVNRLAAEYNRVPQPRLTPIPMGRRRTRQ
jgi:hypothetical protein